MKYNIVLVEPEIPQNTGNIVRTCVATQTALHLVRPLGFSTEDKQLKRAGLDYWSEAEIHYYDSFNELRKLYPKSQFYYLTTKGKRVYSDVHFPDGAFLVFGRETKGLPEDLLANNYDDCLRIPMINETRSLNLSNSVALVLYEALRQSGFENMNTKGALRSRPELDISD
ncbi:MAG: tRNA (uridine(34)/cytosine(34)/5-carboxymethylaminomethyluridine(34)-2'-O)-methyltransferase TrmL [Clostridia bacterium]|nr:tRNA (uridine(34)/cytosine(34)/5-carboxymethylaminomethyluridine(34)-2'-O)-methyltransferase TrmL [Clostridia bacterium]